MAENMGKAVRARRNSPKSGYRTNLRRESHYNDAALPISLDPAPRKIVGATDHVKHGRLRRYLGGSMSGVGVWVSGLLRLPGGSVSLSMTGLQAKDFSPDDHHVGAAVRRGAPAATTGGACCRRGSSARSAPSHSVPARYCEPASRPCRCLGPDEHVLDDARPHLSNGSCCPASPARSAVCRDAPCGGCGCSGPSPSASPRSPPTDRRCPPTRPRPCCPDQGCPPRPGCRAPPRRSPGNAAPACAGGPR